MSVEERMHTRGREREHTPEEEREQRPEEEREHTPEVVLVEHLERDGRGSNSLLISISMSSAEDSEELKGWEGKVAVDVDCEGVVEEVVEGEGL